ncbi:sensor histidine kinase [Mammaliicoccus sp. Dog046]|uniref:sensor histidine kinase n=1 Tax=Mammaliicoccus sp. Dog046 TaxID=3034233 RepID=UPI002B26000E|nr:sensor histidine kinase [Mammaliicoccus sp. Dog046]WQK85883.1 sensor histidine kinase [Mammaliicoccus sp. Dog046]
MLIQFLKERLAWILLFILLQLVIVLMSWLDVAVSTTSAFYILGLNLIIFILFIWLIYSRETRFYSALKDNVSIKEIEHKGLNHSAYEHIIFNYIRNYNENAERTLHEQNNEIQFTKNDLLDWIHEVKTPITAMKLILDQVEDKELKDDLFFEWSRIDYLLDQQLYIRRLTSTSNDFYFDHYSIKDMVIKEIQQSRNISMSKGIGYELLLENQNVYTDEKWCRTVIRQILNNALKYTENGDITIRTSIVHGQICLSIEDYGRGILARDLPRIYERGFTSTTNRRETTATGMGLYLVKEIANELHINVNVTSIYGEGTTVALTFPNPNDYTSLEQASDKNVTSKR